MLKPETAKKFYVEAFKALRKNHAAPEIVVEYYPYVNTNHTIRIRNEKIYVRISDTFENAPESAHRALAYILVGKLLNKNIPSELRNIYKRFVQEDSFAALALEKKRLRGTKRITSPVGERFDLEEVFRKLNAEYFDRDLEMPELSWSERPTFRRLGHHDEAHNTIIISRSLDKRGVPEFVLEFVMYHEMLHVFHPPVYKNGRRHVHTPAFKADEQRFLFYEEAEEWIAENAGNFRKYARS
ncbi:MAG: M48 family peptidase [Pyrinomonadaceae bacterium]|nr:M48 family peptidase [Pyrinomonadaceae bacterium]